MINSVESFFLVEKNYSVNIFMIDIKCLNVSGLWKGRNSGV